MALPSIPLPTDSVEIGGAFVTFRSLSRKEALKLTSDFKEDVDGAESYILMCGMGCSKAEADEWRQVTSPSEAGKLIDGIIYLTGLAKKDEPKDEAKDEEGSDPKA